MPVPVPGVKNPAYGVKLFLNIPVSGVDTFVEVALLKSIDGPGREVGERETTGLDSQADEWEPTLTKNGELSGKLFFDPQCDTHIVLDGYIDTPAKQKWQLECPDKTNGATQYAFTGFLKKLSPNGMEREANFEADFSIRVSGVMVKTKITYI
jgi:hypothetical protein